MLLEETVITSPVKLEKLFTLKWWIEFLDAAETYYAICHVQSVAVVHQPCLSKNSCPKPPLTGPILATSYDTMHPGEKFAVTAKGDAKSNRVKMQKHNP